MWEYRELVIPLQVALDDLPIGRHVAQRCERIIREQLARYRAEGWQADGPAEWDGLWAAGRVRIRLVVGWLGLVGHYEFASATLRLRRPLRDRATGGRPPRSSADRESHESAARIRGEIT